MSLEIRDQDTLVAHATAVAQAVNANLTDIGPGSVVNAVFQGATAAQIWLQLIAIQVLAKSHLSTCVGNDVDTWLEPYGLSRLGATQATGTVTCSRLSATSPVLIPVNCQFKTLDLSQTFQAVADPTNPNWAPGMNGYLCPAGSFSVDVPVRAVVASAAGNVQAGTIVKPSSSVPGLTSCNNALPTVGGSDPESDDDFKARFPRFLATRGFATLDAIQRAVDSVQAGLFSVIRENTNTLGGQQLGFATIYVNDGTPAPTDELLARVRAAVEGARPLTLSYAVLPAPVITANVIVTTTVAAPYDAATQRMAVQVAIEKYINGLGVGESLPFYRLPAIADDIPGVETVSVTLNGGGSPLASAATSVIRTGTVTVS